MDNQKKYIVIAGATGFVGRHLIESLLQNTDYNIVGLTRTKKESTHPRLIFVQCDLFSLLEVEKVLEGSTAAYYLVHSMLPSANLDQGHFYDYDLLLADNFARACKKNKIEQVIYLGGIIPHVEKLSWHLKSRLEVENVFIKTGINFTALRAGLIIGVEGSSFQIMDKLIGRLPVLVCPQWTQNKMSPIDITDITKILVECLLHPVHYAKIYDVSGPSRYTYLQMMKIMAKRRKLLRLFILVPVNFVGFSKLWVRLVTQSSKELVYPLLDSLKHSMETDFEKQFPYDGELKSFEQSISVESLPVKRTSKPFFFRRKNPHVRSIQRLILPQGMNAMDVAHDYMSWLPTFFSPIFFVKVLDDNVVFSIFSPKLELLHLKYSESRSTKDRALFYVVGGLLARMNPKGRLEFRETLDKKFIITAIHDFEPYLPWPIYRMTQALVHLWVMHSFGKHLKKVNYK
ncbi:MAG: NAD-dependent epimerase/dehydratase family protein [Bacteriovoracaceae bacterium]